MQPIDAHPKTAQWMSVLMTPIDKYLAKILTFFFTAETSGRKCSI
jgi:hypothetical protein